MFVPFLELVGRGGCVSIAAPNTGTADLSSTHLLAGVLADILGCAVTATIVGVT